MKLREVMRPKQARVETVRHGETLATAVGCFCRSKVRALVVTDDGRVVGILAIRDLLERLDRVGAAALEEPISEAMTREVVTLGPRARLEEAHEVFKERGFNHLPIVDDDGALLGVVTPADVLAGFADDAALQNELLTAYVRGELL